MDCEIELELSEELLAAIAALEPPVPLSEFLELAEWEELEGSRVSSTPD